MQTAPDPRSRRRARVVVLVLAATALATGFAVDAPAAVLTDVPFSGSASADGIRLSAAAPGFLLVERFSDAGAPTAQSSADSLQTVGYAGYPWPGDETFGLMGTAGGAAGMPLPDFPTSARSSSTTTPRSHKEYGPVVLDATSTASTSTSSAIAPLATSPATAGMTRADTSVVHDSSGGVVARATNRVEAFDLAGVLRIGGVVARAEVTAPFGQQRKFVSSLHVSEVTIAGQTVGLTDKGLVAAGSTTPLGADNPLVQVLAEQNIAVDYLKAESSPDGVTSAGVRITATRDVPGLPEPVQMAYLFGRAHASATAGRDALADQPPAPSGPAAAPPAQSVPVAGAPVPPAVGVPSTVGVAPAPDVPAPAHATPDVAAPPAAAAPVVRRVAALRVNSTWYLVLVLGGVVMTVCAALLRLFGVKALWG